MHFLFTSLFIKFMLMPHVLMMSECFAFLLVGFILNLVGMKGDELFMLLSLTIAQSVDCYNNWNAI